MEKQPLRVLHTGLVLDRSLFTQLPSSQMGECIASIRAATGKHLYVVDSAEVFFTPATLVKLITANDASYKLVNEGLGGFFADAQIAALIGNNAQVIQPHDAPPLVQADAAPAAPGYVFAAVPVGWSVNNNMSLGPTKIKRKTKNSDGDGTMFYMSPVDFEKLWLFASTTWAGLGDATTAKFNSGVGLKTAIVMDDRINIGGNYIRRYELEQVAKYRGWAMPANVAIAA